MIQLLSGVQKQSVTDALFTYQWLLKEHRKILQTTVDFGQKDNKI